MTMDRRHFLKQLSAAALAGTQLGIGGNALSALAADDSDYKALVCVFLFGGMDNHDFLLPYDQSAYRDFARIRQTLLTIQGQSRARESLLPLTPKNAAAGDATWALPPEMPQLKGLFDGGEASIVANVGPLIEPLNREQFFAGAIRVPPRLFSHNDQQATWQASAPEGAQFGWGGLFADAMLASASSANTLAFSTISSTEVGPFLTGRRAFPYQVSTEGASRIYLLDDMEDDDEGDFGSRLQAHLRGENYRSDHLIRRDMANAFANALDTNAVYDNARRDGAPLATTFPESPLGAQLRVVAETIALRQVLGVSRQVFFVGMGGFDTHSSQATSLPQLLAGIDAGLGAFNDAMKEIGANDQVTLFSASDFGRTLAVNGDGTDHGWGAHHIVVGGALDGGKLIGSPPPPILDHDLDVGGGRLIPAYAVEQYAEPLGRWFGLTGSEVDAALPALTNFNRGAVSLFSS